MAVLALVRHGESTWNARGIWTGWENPPLSQKGIEEARKAGKLLKDIKFDLAYTSSLIRAKQTLEEIEKVFGVNLATFENSALKERDYGNSTGKTSGLFLRNLERKALKNFGAAGMFLFQT